MSDAIATPPDQVISIRVPNDLNEKADAAAKATGLRKADVIRLAIDRGVDVLLAQLNKPTVEVSE